MHQIHPLKIHLQLFLIMFMTAVVLVGLSLLVGTGVRPQMVVAQEPLVSPDPPVNTFSLETLEAYGISLEEIQAAGSFTLQVKVSASATSVSAGDLVTFTTTITNLGSSTAQYILFSSTLPTCLSSVTTNFGSVGYISDNAASPTYLLYSPIAVGTPIEIKVSGRTTSCWTGTITYQAYVSPYENQQSSNVFSASVSVVGDEYLYFLPVIRRDPTPTPTPTPTAAFYADFSNTTGNNNWTTSDSGNCDRSITDGEYQIEAEYDDSDDTDCFSAAPEDDYEEGTFKVTAYRKSGNEDVRVGLYINGEGGDEYYLLEVRPNKDKWEFIRVKDGSSSIKKDGTSSYIVDDKNTLQLTRDGKYVYVYINGYKLYTYDKADDDDMGGGGTGVYVRLDKDDDDTDVTVRFDNFYIIE